MSVIEELSNKTVFELKSYAKQNNIDIFGVNKKVDILEIISYLFININQLVVTSKK